VGKTAVQVALPPSGTTRVWVAPGWPPLVTRTSGPLTAAVTRAGATPAKVNAPLPSVVWAAASTVMPARGATKAKRPPAG